MKKSLEIIIQLVIVLFCSIQSLQAQSLPVVSFEESFSGNYESSAQYVNIPVVLSAVSTDTVYVEYAVTGGTATGNGVDYLLYPDYLEFKPGETLKTITIAIAYDVFGEPDETIIITLSNPTNATLGYPDSHTYTIRDDDWNGFEFTSSSSSGYESEGTVHIPVGYFTWLRLGNVSFDYAVTGGTATGGGVDYLLDSGTVVIELGQDTNDIVLSVIDDSISESDETVKITITGGEPNSIGYRSTFTYTILNDDDSNAPSISNYYPEPNSIQVPRDTFVKVGITDDLSGVDVNDVKIYVESELVYDGNNAEPNGIYNSSLGTCRRIGVDTDYTFIFLPNTLFDYEQEVDVIVYARDKDNNTMPKAEYSFYTVMRAFGENLKVNSDTTTFNQDHPSAATDSSGNIWVVWDHTTSSIDSDIYIGMLEEGASSFGASTVVYNGTGLHNNPKIAIDKDDNIYVAWQGQSSIGSKWNIYVSKSADGITWSAPVMVNFSDPSNNYNQIFPAIAIDHDTTDTIYIVCEDNRDGNEDIWLSSSTNGTTWSPKRITTNASNQTYPAIVVSNHVVHLGWTDARNSSNDFYAASSDNGWANEGWIVTSSNQSNVVLATDPVGSALHQFWVDDKNGYYDIYYRMGEASSTGTSVTDEEYVGKNKPAAGVGIFNGSYMPFVAWRDWRNVQSNNDTDIYYAEKTATGFGTNILINDDIGTSPQSDPAVGVGLTGSPYVVWADQRNGNMDIYYSGVTSFGETLSQEYLAYGSSIIVKTSEGVEVSIPVIYMPSGFSYYDISVSRLLNPPSLPAGGCGICYDFKPSGLTFDNAITITIPHNADDCPSQGDTYSVYWYNTQTDSWSQEGISNVSHYILSSSHYVSFQTTHFTSFIVSTEGGSSSGGDDPVVDGSSSSGGGGCAMSNYPQSTESILGYFVPYIVLAVIMLSMSLINKRKRVQKDN